MSPPVRYSFVVYPAKFEGAAMVLQTTNRELLVAVVEVSSTLVHCFARI